VVEAPPLEADDVLLGDVLVALRDQRRQLVADAERRLLALDPLDGVPLEDEVPVGGGLLARDPFRAGSVGLALGRRRHERATLPKAV